MNTEEEQIGAQMLAWATYYVQMVDHQETAELRTWMYNTSLALTSWHTALKRSRCSVAQVKAYFKEIEFVFSTSPHHNADGEGKGSFETHY